MQRIWVVVLSVWAMLAVVAVLAWASRPAYTALPQVSSQQVLVKGSNGKTHLVTVHTASHATTSTSRLGGGGGG